ncbi:carbohydrate ABC transporter permease [Georgenia deserti]|uniref:Carbohydrate ABC transporter permease n=1 Tax=Georgenia deserti TaxID=2093781 RepID=A0ABW4L880_9MICO
MRSSSVRTSLVVVVALIVGVTLVPFMWAITSAFKNDTEIFGDALGLPGTWRWENFVTVWTDGNFSTYFVNSALIAVAATLLTVAVTTPAGYVFGKLVTGRGRNLFYVYLLVMTLPVEAIMVPTFYQLREFSLVDSRLGITLVLVATGIPIGVFITRNFFRDLPSELMESARTEGAGDWRIFHTIMLPLAKPPVLAVAVFSFLGAWNEYQLAVLLLLSEENRTIPLGLAQFQGQHSADYGALFAGIVLAMIPSIVVYLVLQRSFTRGLVAGALK